MAAGAVQQLTPSRSWGKFALTILHSNLPLAQKLPLATSVSRINEKRSSVLPNFLGDGFQLLLGNNGKLLSE